MAVSIDDLLRRAVENKASDLHLKVGNHPYLRVDGLLAPLTDVPRITPEEMNLPPVISKICEEQRGLVLVTGTTGSGKSTTLAAMIDRINANRADHLITIEDPIEFLHRDKKSFINQREVEVDTANFSTALRAALRQDP